MNRQTTSKRRKLPRGVSRGIGLSDVLGECTARLKPARQRHLGYTRECWMDCVELAESLIAHRSNYPADEDVRKTHVFELAGGFFTKHVLTFSEFLELSDLFSIVAEGGSKPSRRNR